MPKAESRADGLGGRFLGWTCRGYPRGGNLSLGT
jgi:hypothetical protein